MAKKSGTKYLAIRHYGRNEVKPSIQAAKNIAKIRNTTVGYLIGETEQENLFKNHDMHKRLNEIEKMDSEDKGHILSVVDGLIKSIKLKIFLHCMHLTNYYIKQKLH
ncbi:XRE family transcriptional regulator [Puteibacter caeruleilacunae]|nr:XRE family transcriptional regulator [Puteibacter caeruleilacunae]